MGRFGGYYKGEKKKTKKPNQKSLSSSLGESASTFRLPEIISRDIKTFIYALYISIIEVSKNGFKTYTDTGYKRDSRKA